MTCGNSAGQPGHWRRGAVRPARQAATVRGESRRQGMSRGRGGKPFPGPIPRATSGSSGDRATIRTGLLAISTTCGSSTEQAGPGRRGAVPPVRQAATVRRESRPGECPGGAVGSRFLDRCPGQPLALRGAGLRCRRQPGRPQRPVGIQRDKLDLGLRQQCGRSGGKTGGVSPTVVQHVDTNMGDSALTTGKTIALPNPTISGNCLVVAIFWELARTTPSRYRALRTTPPEAAIVRRREERAGPDKRSTSEHLCGPKHKSGGEAHHRQFQRRRVELHGRQGDRDSRDFRNGRRRQDTAAPWWRLVHRGRIVHPAQSGDFIYQAAFQDSLSTPAFSGRGPANVTFTAGTSPSQWSFMPGGVNSADGTAIQYLVYGADNAIDPTFNDGGTNANYLTAAVALTPETTQGGVPGAGIRVVAASTYCSAGI